MSRLHSAGFSLIETLIATAIVTLALSALVQLFAVSTRANGDVRRTTRATILARDKMEALRARRDPAGGSLDRNVAGHSDFLDERGRSLGEGDTPPAGAAYLRRWSIEGPLSRPHAGYVLQVVVRPMQHAARVNLIGARGAADERLWGGAQLVALRPSREAR